MENNHLQSQKYAQTAQNQLKFEACKSHRSIRRSHKKSQLFTSRSKRSTILQGKSSIVNTKTEEQLRKELISQLQMSHLKNNPWRVCQTTATSPQKQQIHKNPIIESNKIPFARPSLAKIYNHVNELQINYEEPEISEFINMAVHSIERNKEQSKQNISNKIFRNNNFPNNNGKKQFQYKISSHRQELRDLEKWIRNKMKTINKQELKNNQTTVISQKINFLNMAFNQVSKIIGTFSKQCKDMINYLHLEYDQYNQFLSDCMMKHNLELKKQIQVSQDKLFKAVEFYQLRQGQIKTLYDQKSKKVISNFHQCIQLKKKNERQLRDYKILFANKKNQVKLLQEGLKKTIKLFLSYNANNMESPSKSQSTEIQYNKKKFEEWCGYLMKMIDKSVSRQHKKGKKKSQGFNSINDQAFQIIQQYMVDNNQNISMNDAKMILEDFMCSQQEQKALQKRLQSEQGKGNKQILKKKLKEVQFFNSNFQNMYTNITLDLPTFDEAWQRVKRKQKGIQVQLKLPSHSQAVQVGRKSQQVCIQTFPMGKDRCTETRTWQSYKNKLVSEVYKLHFHQPIIVQDKVKKSKVLRNSRSIEPKFTTRSSRPSYNIDLRSIQSELKQQISRVKSKRLSLQKHKPSKKVSKLIKAPPKIRQQQQQQTSALVQTAKHKYLNEDDTSYQIKLIPPKSKRNGFRVTENKKVQSLSQRFIAEQQLVSSSEQSSESSSCLDILKSRRESSSNFSSSKANTIKQSYSQQWESKWKNLKQKSFQNKNKRNDKTKRKNSRKLSDIRMNVIANRSFFHQTTYQYSSQSRADKNRNNSCVLMAPKKIDASRNHLVLDPHDFHLELTQRKHQKLHFLSRITLWHPKVTSEMKKTRRKQKHSKALVQINDHGEKVVKKLLNHVINPILKNLLKQLYLCMNTQQSNFGQTLKSPFFSSNDFKSFTQLRSNKSKGQGNLLTYYHRLSPLFFAMMNYIKYHKDQTADSSHNISVFRAFRYFSKKLKIYNIILDGGSLYLDIFIKLSYHFSLSFNDSLDEDPLISFYIIENNLSQALQDFVGKVQIDSLMSMVKKYLNYREPEKSNMSRTSFRSLEKLSSFTNIQTESIKGFTDYKIGFFELLKIVFKYVKERQQAQAKRYCLFIEIISKNLECSYYEDLLIVLECLPIQHQKKRKILDECLKYAVYWQKPETMVPNDILFFILDKNQLYSSPSPSVGSERLSVLQDYIINRCELYFKVVLKKITSNPECVLINSTSYAVNFKIPKLFYRVLQQIKTNTVGSKKVQYCLLTIIFCNLIDNENDKIYLPSLFNGLLSIPGVQRHK